VLEIDVMERDWWKDGLRWYRR